MIVILPVVFAAMEMLTGGIFKLNWPDSYYYGIVSACGFVGGAMMGKYRIAGAIGGAVGAAGALIGVAIIAEQFGWVNKLVLLIGGAIGCLPGLGIYAALAALLKSIERIGPQEADLEQFKFDKPRDRP